MTIKVYERGNVKLSIEKFTDKDGNENFQCVRLVDNQNSASQVLTDLEDALDVFEYWLDAELGEDL